MSGCNVSLSIESRGPLGNGVKNTIIGILPARCYDLNECVLKQKHTNTSPSRPSILSVQSVLSEDGG